MMRWAAASVLVALAARAQAAAPPPSGDLEAALGRARVCWAALDPECAERELQAVRPHLEALAPALQLEALRISAEIALSNERAAEAQGYLLALLERDPRFTPSGWPRPWLEALETARKAAPDRLPPSLEVVLPAEARPRIAVPIEVRVEDPSGIARCEIVFADGQREGLLAADGVVFRGEIPRDRVHAPELALHVEALDRAGNLALWPASGEHRLPVAPPKAPKATPLTGRWWFWTAIGAVVAGGVAGLVLALDGGDAQGVQRIGDLRVVPETP